MTHMPPELRTALDGEPDLSEMSYRVRIAYAQIIGLVPTTREQRQGIERALDEMHSELTGDLY